MNPGEWLIPWEPSASIIAATIAIGLVYTRGSLRVRPEGWRQACFWSGLASFYLVVQSYFDYGAEHSFFMGQLQNGTLQHAAPFLVALSGPCDALWAGLPRAFRPGMPAGMRRAGSTLYDLLSQPLVAIIIFDGLILLWLIPGVHFFAMLDWRLYRLMNWSMALDGLLFWGMALSFRSPWSQGTRIAVLLAVLPAQIAAGAVLFFSVRDLYPVYALCGRAFAGLSALEDQQLGGLVLWLHGAMMSILGVLVVAARRLPARRFSSAVS